MRVAVVLLLVLCACGGGSARGAGAGAGGECEERLSCAACTRAPGCVWCPADKHKGPRCRPPQASQCEAAYIDPKSHLTTLQNDAFREKEPVVQLRPQRIEISARPGQSEKFEFFYKPAQDYPLDVYYLVDFSFSMKKFKDVMEKQGTNIYNTLSRLTNNVVMGIGSFIEKPALPYSSKYKKTYSFKNHLSLMKADKIDFNKVLKNVKTEGNYDNPEASLDALLQVMVCRKEIGWRENTTRLILLTTDDMYHGAGDGKMAGAFRRHDGRCHMEEGNYTLEASLSLDYPSVQLLNHVATKNHFVIIFVVPPRVKREYEALSGAIVGSKVAPLSKEEDKVIKLVEDEYKTIMQSFKFISQNVPRDLIELTYNPDCEHKGCPFTHRGSVKVKATLKVLSCPNNLTHTTHNIKIQAIGNRESLDIKLNLICDCKSYSDQYPSVKNSPLCSNSGTYELGTCICNPGRVGQQCQCLTDQVTNSEEDLKKCRKEPSESGPECNGRGACVCATCQCVEGRYSGRLCECDDEDPSCFPSEGWICSGNGNCKCGSCICKENYSGKHCATYCNPSPQLCKHPFDDKVCSGNGECSCGECRCTGDAFGKYCEQCADCNYLDTYCSLFHACVSCHRDSGADCASNCTLTNDLRADNVSSFDNPDYEALSSEDWTECHTLEENVACYALFKYRVVDNSVLVAVQTAPDCTKQESILMFVGSFIAGAVLVGLLTLLLWKLLTELHDKREYQRFKKEMESAEWADNDNPLYNDPTTTFRNPAFKE